MIASFVLLFFLIFECPDGCVGHFHFFGKTLLHHRICFPLVVDVIYELFVPQTICTIHAMHFYISFVFSGSAQQLGCGNLLSSAG